MNHSSQIKRSVHGDEYYTLESGVNMIVPYIYRGGYEKSVIWCPFDKEDSNYVRIFKANGFDVRYGHIETGQDFFQYDKPQGDIIISNPPFGKRDAIFKKIYEWDLPFALLINFNGLFDSKARVDIFRTHSVEMLIPRGRMKFFHRDNGLQNNPNFQSIYVCNHFLGKQIVFDETTF